jgi:DNA-binding GntR family transcriptional regulator
MQTEPLRRTTLVDAATERLREMILDGRIAREEKLSEPMLARLLGVSRTPLREAIARLRHEGLIETDHVRRFHVTAANAELVREVYPIVGTLEAAALRLSAPHSLPDVSELRSINERIRTHKGARSRLFEFDRELHRLFSAGCPNARLLSVLEHHRRLAERVDGAGYRGLHARERSYEEHGKIIAAIAKQRIDEASRLIERHYLDGIEIIADWLEKNA